MKMLFIVNQLDVYSILVLAIQHQIGLRIKIYNHPLASVHTVHYIHARECQKGWSDLDT